MQNMRVRLDDFCDAFSSLAEVIVAQVQTCQSDVVGKAIRDVHASNVI